MVPKIFENVPGECDMCARGKLRHGLTGVFPNHTRSLRETFLRSGAWEQISVPVALGRGHLGTLIAIF